MAFFEWKDQYAVHVHVIDEQHHTLIAILNELHEAMRGGRARDVLGSVLDQLVKYTMYHFRTEEQLFEANRYPDIASHKREHDALTRTVAAFQTDFHNGRIYISLDVMNLLSDWLQHHILETDKLTGPFLNANGVH